MNKRARNRLIGVTAIIIIIIGAIFAGTSANTGAKTYATVAEIQKDPNAVGRKLTVAGIVIPGSWDKKASSDTKLRFAIADGDKEGNVADPNKKIAVVYPGTMPATFGDNVQAIVTGKLGNDGTIQASEMVIKCPEKKAKGTSAMAVDQAIKNKAALVGVPFEVKGVITPGSIKPAGTEPRFTVQTKDGAAVLPVAFTQGIPESVKDNVEVVIFGNMDSSGLFTATSVAVATK